VLIPLQKAPTVTPQQADAIVHQAKAAWLQGDAAAFARLFTPTGKFMVPGRSWQGQGAILDAFQKFNACYKVQSITIHNLVLQGDHAFLEWLWEEQALDSGQISTAEDAIAIDFQGNLIQRWREYIDSESAPADNG